MISSQMSRLSKLWRFVNQAHLKGNVEVLTERNQRLGYCFGYHEGFYSN